MLTPQPPRSEKIDIRLTSDAKRLLQRAARERHTTISQFVLENALSAASDVLTESHQISMNAEQWTVFMSALDAQPRRHARMERLLTEPTLLD